MLYYNFKNYKEFQAQFGIQKHGNGNKSRKNRILLSYLKDQHLLHESAQSGDCSLLAISDMAGLKYKMKEMISESGRHDSSLLYDVRLMNETYRSAIYSTDGNNGLCEDGDSRAVRYINHNNGGRIYKMKAGKLYRALILETEFGRKLPEQVVTYLCEEFASDWQSYAMCSLPQNTLHVNDDFERIYSSNYCLGNFGSCMLDKELHTFYEDAVEAKAAYLENADGMIIARCVIYTSVYDEKGNVWRLAERQYASDGSTIYCRALVDALVREGYIDGYKVPGAGCGESRNFVDVKGQSLSHKKFRIDCKLDWDDCVSYQDSFKWYNMYNNMADNYGYGDYDLAITEGSLSDADEDRAYDDYHDEYCDETITVFVHGHEYQCAYNWLDDFRWVESLEEYHHLDDITQCPYCETWILKGKGHTSDIIGDDEEYCSGACLENAESEYMKSNWHYSDFDGCYYENESDVTTYLRWIPTQGDYVEKTISVDTLMRMIDKYGDNTCDWMRFDGMIYDQIDPQTELPYNHYELQYA